MLDSLKAVWTFTQKPSSPLKYTDLLVYSYLANRDRFGGKTPSNAAIARATGLAETTVAASVKRLRDDGFVVENRPVDLADHFFRKGGGRHWSEKNQFFKAYLPSEGSPLSTADAMVFSYVLHLSQLENKPRELRAVYVANALGMDTRTVQASFERLEKLQLLKITDDKWAVPKHLVGQQLGWFMGKQAAPQTNGVEFDTFEPDVSALSGLKDKTIDPDNDIAPVSQPVIMKVSGVPCTPIDVKKHLASLSGLDPDDWQQGERLRVLTNKVYRTMTEGDKQAGIWKAVVEAKHKEVTNGNPERSKENPSP